MRAFPLEQKKIQLLSVYDDALRFLNANETLDVGIVKTRSFHLNKSTASLLRELNAPATDLKYHRLTATKNGNQNGSTDMWRKRKH